MRSGIVLRRVSGVKLGRISRWIFSSCAPDKCQTPGPHREAVGVMPKSPQRVITRSKRVARACQDTHIVQTATKGARAVCVTRCSVRPSPATMGLPNVGNRSSRLQVTARRHARWLPWLPQPLRRRPSSPQSRLVLSLSSAVPLALAPTARLAVHSRADIRPRARARARRIPRARP